MSILIVWFVIGWLMFMWLADKRERRDFNESLVAIILWPVALFLNKVIAPIRRAKKERARQERISEEVRNGTYEATYASTVLGWRGFKK